MSPFFSVIVPVYKVEAYLCECVDSILGQRFADFELILVDDGSPDSCPAICDGYAASDARVRVIHKKNGGPNSSRNAGITAAEGEYVCFADSDDYAEPDWLETMHDDITANDFPDMLAYGYYIDPEDPGGEPYRAKNRIAPGLYDKAALERDVYPYMLSDRRDRTFGSAGIIYSVWTKAGKRALYAEHMVRDESISVGEDSAMTFGVLCAANSLFISDRQLYHYRIRSNSITTGTVVEKRLSDLRRAYGYMRKELAESASLLGPSLNDWYTKQLMDVISDTCGHSGVRQASSVLRKALKKTCYLQDLRLAGLPFRIGLFILPLKLRLVFVTVLMQKTVNRIF